MNPFSPKKESLVFKSLYFIKPTEGAIELKKSSISSKSLTPVYVPLLISLGKLKPFKMNRKWQATPI